MSRRIMNGLDLQNQKITAVADPSAGTDAANKQYVDNVARGLYWKDPVRAASTANVSLSAPGATLDGVTLANGNRVLLKNQTAPAENGVYVWTGASSALTRSADADSGSELNPGTAVTVTEGTANGDKAFLIVSDAAVTIGTTATTWGQLGGGSGTTYTAGNGLALTGSTFSVNAGNGIIADGTSTRVDPSVVVRKFAANVPAQTNPAFTHGLGTADLTVAVYEVATGVLVEPDVTVTNTTATLGFAVAPAANAYRVVVQG